MFVAKSLAKMLIIIFCAIITISCGGNRQQPQPTEKPQPPKTYVFDCLNKASYTVRFDKDQALVFLPVGTVLLARQPSSAGAKYSDGKTSIWQRGDIALLHMGGVPLGDCYNNPREAAWENARLNGVGFRAAGDKPAWYLEITDKKEIVFAPTGKDRQIEFPFADPKISNSNLTKTYETKTERHQLTVVAVEMECKDPASGKIYDWMVTVRLDGATYSGCGRTWQ